MHIGIIGGGISGICSAYYLRQAGCQVTLLDAGDLKDGCSHGNAGMIVPSHVVPLAAPGMIAKGLRWMLRSTSPFYVKPRLNADLLRWGWLFYQHANAAHVSRSVPVLRDLSLLSQRLYQELAIQLPFKYQERGLLMLFQSTALEHELAEEAALANRSGLEARMLSGPEVQALEPGTPVTVRGAAYYPGDAHVSPNELIRVLLAELEQSDVGLHRNEPVTDFLIDRGRIREVVTSKMRYPFDEVVLATGAWSPELTRKLGFSLPLQGGKGYSFAVESGTPPRIPAILMEARATVTPMNGQVRIAGTLEIAGTDLSVNPSRVRGIAESIQRYYPDLAVETPPVATVWRGLRPCSPDGLPYLGRVTGFDNLTLATGHGMMGLSLGPATGKLVAETITGQPTRVPLRPFAPDRFR